MLLRLLPGLALDLREVEAPKLKPYGRPGNPTRYSPALHSKARRTPKRRAMHQNVESPENKWSQLLLRVAIPQDLNTNEPGSSKSLRLEMRNSFEGRSKMGSYLILMGLCNLCPGPVHNWERATAAT